MVRFEYYSCYVHQLTHYALQGGVFSSMSGLLKTATGSNQRAEKKTRETKTSPADVVRAALAHCRIHLILTII